MVHGLKDLWRQELSALNIIKSFKIVLKMLTARARETQDADLETGQGQEPSTTNQTTTETLTNDHEDQKLGNRPKWYLKLVEAGVEENGVRPVPPEQRQQTQYNNLFTVFFTCLLCVLP